MNEIERAIEQLDMQIKCMVVTTSIKTCRLAIEALENQLKLQQLGFTNTVLANYKQFEDECMTKGFTFKSMIEAREKQIPKKPIDTWESDTERRRQHLCRWACPNCGTFLGFENKHCTECGTKIKWDVIA